MALAIAVSTVVVEATTQHTLPSRMCDCGVGCDGSTHDRGETKLPGLTLLVFYGLYLDHQFRRSFALYL